MFDLLKPWKINPESFFGKSKNSPFDGMLVEGKNIMTFVREDLFIDFNFLIIFIICYFIGSIPFGLLLSKLTKKNDPSFGSKNIGATNMLRVGGWRLGFMTLILMLLKDLSQ